jgi:hypothetical protein
MPGDGPFPELQESLVFLVRVMRLAVNHGDRTRVNIFLPIQPGDQLVKLFKVRVVLRFAERVNHHRMNFAGWCCF